LSEPPRRIIHIDMDAFYASVEMRDDPQLRGKPVVVGGSPESRGVVAAASYEAREFGVRSAMPMSRALRLCPQLVIVRPDFRKYREASERVMEILHSATPLVEPLSLDEAYLDVTENSWGMPLARDVAIRIKKTILDETGLTASAGVAPNKFLAKIASGWQKPDGLTVIAPERVESFLQKLPVEALWGVGPVTAKKLRAVGIQSLVDVRNADFQVISKAVGSLAEWLVQLSHGDDPRPVEPHRETKSVSCETTFAEDLKSLAEINEELARLARELAQDLAAKSLRARTTVTRSHTAKAFTASKAEIVNRAQMLLERTEADRRPVRLLGVGAHGLTQEP
jgi:DNA polymerase-4